MKTSWWIWRPWISNWLTLGLEPSSGMAPTETLMVSSLILISNLKSTEPTAFFGCSVRQEWRKKAFFWPHAISLIPLHWFITSTSYHLPARMVEKIWQGTYMQTETRQHVEKEGKGSNWRKRAKLFFLESLSQAMEKIEKRKVLFDLSYIFFSTGLPCLFSTSPERVTHQNLKSNHKWPLIFDHKIAHFPFYMLATSKTIPEIGKDFS